MTERSFINPKSSSFFFSFFFRFFLLARIFVVLVRTCALGLFVMRALPPLPPSPPIYIFGTPSSEHLAVAGVGVGGTIFTRPTRYLTFFCSTLCPRDSTERKTPLRTHTYELTHHNSSGIFHAKKTTCLPRMGVMSYEGLPQAEFSLCWAIR